MTQPPDEPARSSSAAELSWNELADALWLASQITPTPHTMRHGHGSESGTGSLPAPADARDRTSESPPPLPEASAIEQQAASGPGPHGHEPTGNVTTGGSPATPLRGELAIGRALRPLTRPEPSRWRTVLDDEATAVYAAETGLWWPQIRPAEARGLDAVVVADDGPSMAIWRSTIAAFGELLARHGAFRDVRKISLSTDHPMPRELTWHGRPIGSTGHPAAWMSPGRRQIVFVLTDGVGPAWRADRVPHWLGRYGRRGPLVVINLLPHPRWHWCQFDAPLVSLRAHTAGATDLPQRYELRSPTGRPDDTRTAALVPVLELDSRWLARWVSLVTTTGWINLPALSLDNDDMEPNEELDFGEPPSEKTQVERVMRFRANAAPQAFALASLLAAAPLNLATMRQVQHRMLPNSTPADLAEFIIGGLIYPLRDRPPGADSNAVDYDFHPGVRAELLSAGTRANTFRVIRTISDLLDTTPADMLAERHPLLAEFRLTVLKALAGPYLARSDLMSSEATLAADGPQHPTSTRTPPIWGDVPPRDHMFVGRDDLLRTLRERLRQGSTAVVLHGPGGIGKTELAVEYCYRHARDYDLVWWIAAHDSARIAAAFHALAGKLELTEGSNARAALTATLAALRDGSPASRWLLVFDDAEELADVAPFLPSGNGHVLITSRNTEWFDVVHPVGVPNFNRDESRSLLWHHCPRLSNLDVDRIADASGDVPLAIALAAAWQQATDMPAAEHVRLLMSQSVADEPTDVPRAVTAAGRLAVRRLREQVPSARRLIDVLAFFAATPVPRKIVTSAGFTEERGDPIELSRLFRAIQSHGLAVVDHRRDTVAPHRSLLPGMRDQLGADVRRNAQHTAHLVLRDALPAEPNDAASWAICADILPHVRASGAVDCADLSVRGTVVALIGYLLALGDHRAAVELAEAAVDTWTVRLGQDHADTLAAARQLGVARYALGQYPAAQEVHRRTHELLTRTVGLDHQDTLSLSDLLARDLRAVGDFAAAKALNQDAYRRAKRRFGDTDPRTIAAASQLVANVLATGDLTGNPEALQLQEQTVRRNRELYGDSHPNTSIAVLGLAAVLRLAGEPDLAMELDETARNELRDALGDHHPATIACTANLASDLAALGQHEQAANLDDVTATQSSNSLGANNPTTLAIRLNTSLDLRSLGRLTEADRLHADVLQHLARVMGQHHPATRAARTGQRATCGSELIPILQGGSHDP